MKEVEKISHVKKSDVLLTIFTPTYNRGYVFGRSSKRSKGNRIVTLYFVKKITGSLGKRDTEVRKWVCEKRYNGRNQKERI